MAEDTPKNNEEKDGRKAIGTLLEKIKKHPIIAIVIITTIIIIIISVSDYYNKKKTATEDPNDPKNGPAAANEFLNNVYIDKNGKLKFEKSIKELWNELKEKGNALTKYLDSPQQLAKLFSASIVTDYPDTRENPDSPIDWDALDLKVDSTDVQGIVKFKRALSSGNTITMKYISPTEFQKKMNKYNKTGKKEDRDEALKYFTLERTLAGSGNSIDVGSRAYNNDVLNFTDNIDIYAISHNLFGGAYDAVQGCCFDGKYIICSANKGTNGNNGGRIFWIDAETKRLEPKYVDIGSEGGHMEGIAYDSANKWVLVGASGSKLIRIDVNKNKSYIKIPKHFSHYAYSVTTQELLGYKSNKVTFMKYNASKDEYEKQRTITLSGANVTHIQGISCDGQVIFLADSRPNTALSPSKYRLWAFDFQGNMVEEHAMGTGYKRGTSECENSYVDKLGNLWILLPHEVVKAVGYKANPVDWENNVSTISTTTTSTATGSSAQVEEILQYACSWIGKIDYKIGADGKLVAGGKSDCSHFVHRVFGHFGLMDDSKDGFVHSLDWGKGGGNGGCPGTKNIGTDMSKASPGDVIWEHYGLGSNNHVYIYLGKDSNGKYKKVQCAKTDHAKGVYISNVNTRQVDGILHFDSLPTDPKAYFDYRTGELHSTITSSNSSTSNENKSNTQSATNSQNSANNSNSNNKTISGQDIVNEAEKYVGKSIQLDADCSKFCFEILRKLGLYNGAYVNTVGFETLGSQVSFTQAQAGDIIIFGPEKGHSTNMGIYDGKGGLILKPGVGKKVIHITSLETMGNILTIRRFTSTTSEDTNLTTELGPVNTDETFGQFSVETRKIILEHRNDFDQSNFKQFFQNYQGGYNQYLKDLGGVFAKYGGRDTPMNVTDAGTFQEVAEYTWGLFAIWGFNYYNGSFRVRWGEDNNEVAESAFYKGSDNGSYSSGHIDDICSDLGRVNRMRTNCNCGSNAFLQKCGLTEDKNFTTYWKKGEHIDNPEDLQIGDLVHFFSSDGEWHHVAVVGEIDSELGPILYDSGNRFIRSGNYKFPYNSSKYSKYPIKRGRRFFNLDQSTAGQIGTGAASDDSVKYVYKVKVATWQENIERIESTNSAENKNERNYSMNPKTIPYQDIVSQYRMPFNYLWTMLIYSNNDKNYIFDLANLVRNSKIEITIHDNYNETTTTTIEKKQTNYFYTGQANAEFEYSYDTGQERLPNIWQKKTLPDLFKAESESHEYYRKKTTIIDKTDTLDIALTLADTWCVKYEKKYKYNGRSSPNSSTTTQTLDDEDGETEEYSTISNSDLRGKIINSATSAANIWMSQQTTPGVIKQPTIIHNSNEKQTERYTITNQKITTIVTTIESSYTGEPEKFYTEETPKFAIVFNKHYNARSNILSAKAWFFEALESNADTANMVDLTKYLMYKATGTNYGVTTFEFKVYNMQDIGSEYGDTGSRLNMTSTTLSRQQFIEKTKSYSAALANGPATKTFRDNAGVIYDVCVKNNVNPVLCAAQGWAEQNWMAPGTSPYNYWGIAVYNGQNYGSSYSSMQAAVENYCKNINQRMKGENGALTWSKSNSKYNKKFTGSISTLYDVLSNWACADDYATNPASQAKHAADYVDKIITIAKTIYGEGALSTDVGTSSVVEFAMKYKGKKASEFGLFNYKSKHGASDKWFADEWCAMFVSFCFDNCGLIPNPLKDSYSLCSDGWNRLGDRQEKSAARGGNYKPKPGDIIFFGNNAGQHTGIVVKCDGNKVYTIEGNTGNTGFNNSIVSEASYALNNSWIWGYGRMSS